MRKHACLNYREFDLESDLVGTPHSENLSDQSFITLLKLAWRECDLVAINNWKKTNVGLQRTRACKRTVDPISFKPFWLLGLIKYIYPVKLILLGCYSDKYKIKRHPSGLVYGSDYKRFVKYPLTANKCRFGAGQRRKE